MRVRGLLLWTIVVAGAVYLWLEKPYRTWFRSAAPTAGRVGGAQTGPSPSSGPTEPTPEERRWTRPRPPDGEYVEVTLLEPPAAAYGSPSEEHLSDAAYRDVVTELVQETGHGGPDGVVYDLALARAAREVAYHTGRYSHPPPDPGLTFLLHASGAPEMSAAQYFTHSTSDELDVVRDTVRRALTSDSGARGEGPLRIGIGEVSTPDSEYTRHVSVLVTRRAYDIEPISRTVPPGGMWRLRGRLPDGYREPHGFALYPDGRMESLPVNVGGGGSFDMQVPAGDAEGTIEVGIDGIDRRGPGKLLQLSVVVGRQPPRHKRVYVPAIESAFEHIEDAEAYAVSLLAADRQRWGRARLQPDDALAEIARAHSEEMRDREFFAHLSPTTGLAADRLQRSGYRATMHAENLAQNDSLGEAQAALMASVGHRKNILDDRPTHVGIGLAAKTRGERTIWYVTQVFARPVVPLDIVEARSQLFTRLLDARSVATLAPVAENERMSSVAGDYASLVAEGELSGVARRALSDLSEMNVTMSASVHAIYDLDTFDLPEGALDEAVAEIGVGIRQSDDDAHGRIGVVLIFAHAPQTR